MFREDRSAASTAPLTNRQMKGGRREEEENNLNNDREDEWKRRPRELPSPRRATSASRLDWP